MNKILHFKYCLHLSFIYVAQRLCNGLPRNDSDSIPGGNGVKTELNVLRKEQ